MIEPDPQEILQALRDRLDPGLPIIDWIILECLASGLRDDAIGARVSRTPETVRRRISEMQRRLIGDLDVSPNREPLVSWYHLHNDDPPPRRAG